MPKMTKTVRTHKAVSGSTGYCRKCQKTLALQNNFYEATNPMLDSNGFLSICKNCCYELYNHYYSIYGNIDSAIKFTCRDLDIRYCSEALRQTQSQIENATTKGKPVDKVFGIYKSKLGSTGKNNTGIDMMRFKDSDNMEKQITDSISPEINSDFELTEDVIKFWGVSQRFQKEDYEYLTNKYMEYINTYECDTPTMEELLKQAAFESLEIRMKRMSGDDVSKNLKNLQEILGSANIKPNQETGANATEQATFGVLIKKWENEEPIPEPDEQWKDVDGIGKYIRVWFLGHLCKMLGISNEYSQEYEEEMARLRVEMPSDDSVFEEEGD